MPYQNFPNDWKTQYMIHTRVYAQTFTQYMTLIVPSLKNIVTEPKL